MRRVAADTFTLRKRRGRLRGLLVDDKLAVVSALFILIIVFAAVFAPLVAPHDPAQQDLLARLLPPAWSDGGSASHLLGTDQLGRDTLSRIIYASRISLLVASIVVAVTIVVGTLLGLAAGYFGGRIDNWIMSVTDAFMAFPGLLLIMSVAAFMGPGLLTIIAALSVRFWTTYARIARGAVLALRETDFMLAAKVVGGSEIHRILRHLLPNIFTPLVTLIPLELGRVMLAEASVSFLGLGVQAPVTSWGLLVAEGRDFISSAWWLITFPGLVLFLTILATNLLGNWLLMSSDPIHRER